MERKTLSQQLAEAIREKIVAGDLAPRDSLPTEPELATQHEVSRQVVRDAVRILLAWGLIDVRHGRGMYVTEVDNPSFGDALLLALRRSGATVWDVEEFEFLIYPRVARQAAVRRSPDQAEELAGKLGRLPDAVREAMQQTPVGGIARIPVSIQEMALRIPYTF